MTKPESINFQGVSNSSQMRVEQPTTVGAVHSESHRKTLEGQQGESSISTEDEIRNASKQFYAGLNRMANGNTGPLADIW